MKKCPFCKNKYKNLHGLHIHQFYCYVKSFTELPVKFCSLKKANDLMSDSFFIPDWRYWPKSLFKYIKTGEVGMSKGIRYITK